MVVKRIHSKLVRVNKMKFSYLSLLLGVCLFTGCHKSSLPSIMAEHFREYNYEPEVIKNSKITSRTKTEIPGKEDQIVLLKDGESVPINKVRAIDYFDDEGYLI